MAAQWLTLAPAGQDMRGPELTSTLPLAVSCSIDAVRGSFQPFPVIRRTRPQRPLARPERHQQEVRNAAKRIAAAACAAQTAQAAFPCRRLKGADVQDVKQLHEDTLAVKYPRLFYHTLVADAGTKALVVRSPRTHALEATIAARLLDSCTLYILTLAVADSERRRGVASRLLRALLREAMAEQGVEAMSVRLHVEVENAGARALYRSLGLVDAALERGYYHGKDAIEMVGVCRLETCL